MKAKIFVFIAIALVTLTIFSVSTVSASNIFCDWFGIFCDANGNIVNSINDNYKLISPISVTINNDMQVIADGGWKITSNDKDTLNPLMSAISSSGALQLGGSQKSGGTGIIGGGNTRQQKIDQARQTYFSQFKVDPVQGDTQTIDDINYTYDVSPHIEYDFDWGQTNIYLYRNDGTQDGIDLYNTQNDDGTWKFGGVDNNLADGDGETSQFIYTINSTDNLRLKEQKIYHQENYTTSKIQTRLNQTSHKFYNITITENKTKQVYDSSYPVFSNNHNGDTEFTGVSHKYDFKDICSKPNANCKWSLSKDGLSAIITFTSDKNIDPLADPVSTCGDITSPGYYHLTTGVNGDGTCITIDSDNVTLDGNSQILTFNNVLGDNHNGIEIINSHNNITIENFAGINDYDTTGTYGDDIGIMIDNDLSNSTIQNNVINTYGGYASPNYYGSDGITFSYSSNSFNDTLNNNTISSTNGHGISYYSSSSSNNTLNNNIINSNSDGISYYSSSSSSDTLNNNTISSTNGHGISYYFSSSDTLNNNTISSTNYDGIYYYSSSSDTLNNNIINSNGDGISYYSSSSSDTLNNNTISSTNGNGISYSSSSSSDTLNNNIINSNYDGISYSSSSSDTLNNNTISSTNGNGISYYFSSSSDTLNNNTISSGQTAVFYNNQYFCDYQYYPGCATDEYSCLNNCGGTIWSLPNDFNNFLNSNKLTSTIFDLNTLTSQNNFTLQNQNITTYNFGDIAQINFINNNGKISLSNTTEAINGTNLFFDNNSDIQLSNNFAFVNSTNSGLNQPADINFYNLNFVNPLILRDGITCPGSICSNLVQVGNNYSFSVTGWSNYSIGQAPTIVSSCSGFTQTMTYLIPGFLALAVLIAGGIVFALGFQKNNIKTMIFSFIIIILGLVFVSIIANITIATC